MTLVLAGIKLPPEIAIPLALLGAAVFVALLVRLGLQRLGKRGSAVLGAVVLACLSVWVVMGAKLDGHLDDLARVERERSERVTKLMKVLPREAPFAEACSGAGPWSLDRLPLVYSAIDGGEPVLRVVEFHPSSDALYGNDQAARLRGGHGVFNGMLDVGFPHQWSERLSSRDGYPLGMFEVAVVAQDLAAAVVELETGKVLCGGALPSPFRADFYGGFDKNVRSYLAAMEPLCPRLGDDACGRMQKAKTKAY